MSPSFQLKEWQKEWEIFLHLIIAYQIISLVWVSSDFSLAVLPAPEMNKK